MRKNLAEQVEWNGHYDAIYGIDCESIFTEVKSTTSRNKSRITLSNLFQLAPQEWKKLFRFYAKRSRT